MDKNEIKYFCEEIAKKEREIAYAAQFMANIMTLLRDGKQKPAILVQIDLDSEIYAICDLLWKEIERWHKQHKDDGED